MSYRTRVVVDIRSPHMRGSWALDYRGVVGIRCDQPGCRNVVDIDDTEWYEDKSGAEDAAFEQDWQTCDHGEGERVRHYCPKHIHVKCTRCGFRWTGNLPGMVKNGWRNPLDTERTLCPTCAELPTISPCICGGKPVLHYGGDYEGLTLMGNYAKITCPDCGRTISDDGPTTVEDIAWQVSELWNDHGNRPDCTQSD